jgi:uncharacterized protein YeaC (DUF1315 family)
VVKIKINREKESWPKGRNIKVEKKKNCIDVVGSRLD